MTFGEALNYRSSYGQFIVDFWGPGGCWKHPIS